MKILQIASGDFFSSYGGGQVYVKNIVDEMIRQGLDVTVLSFVGNEISLEEKDYKGISLWEVGLKSTTSDIEKLVQSISPDIIHAHSKKALFTTLGECLHIPVIVTAHHGGILCPAGTLMNANDKICQTTLSHKHCLKCCLANIRTGRSWYPMMRLLPKNSYVKFGKALLKLPFIPFITPIGNTALSIQNKIAEWQTICNKATKVIAPGHAIAEAMCRNGLSRDKVEVVPHGIPKIVPAIIKNKQDDKIRFFYVGRIGRVKGINILLEAFSRLPFHNRIELHIIGEGGNSPSGRQYMSSLYRRYPNSNIIWHGKLPPNEINKTIQSFDVMVHPAIYLEVFGLNMSESLAMNKPVLATRCGGAEMQIVNDVNGWLVEPNNVESLRAKMEEIIVHGIMINTTSLNEKVVSIEKHIRTLLDMYCALVRVCKNM